MVVTHKHMYPGTTIQRTVMLYHGLVFLFDRLSSDREHDYDFVYRNAGRMTLDVPLVKTGRPMGDERDSFGLPTGYALFRNVTQATLSKTLRVVWDRLKSKGTAVRLTQWLESAEKATLTVPEGPLGRCWGRLCADAKAIYTEDAPPKAKGPCKSQYYGRCIIVRKRGKTASFLTVLEPHRTKPRITRLERIPLALAGRTLGTTDGVAFRVHMDGQAHVVMMCPAPGTKTYGGLKRDAHFDARYVGDL